MSSASNPPPMIFAGRSSLRWSWYPAGRRKQGTLTNKPSKGTNRRKHQPGFLPMFLRRELAGMSINPSVRNVVIADPLVAAERMPPKTAMPMTAPKNPSLPIPSYFWGDGSLGAAIAASGGLYGLMVDVVNATLGEAEAGRAGGGKSEGKVSASRPHSPPSAQT